MGSRSENIIAIKSKINTNKYIDVESEEIAGFVMEIPSKSEAKNKIESSKINRVISAWKFKFLKEKGMNSTPRKPNKSRMEYIEELNLFIMSYFSLKPMNTTSFTGFE
jgi:methionyl-tRNA synthetase